MPELVNPPLMEHGFVQGRFVTAIADGLGDENRYPDLKGIVGKVKFTPKQTVTLFGGEYPATVTREPQVLDLNPQGWVVDASSKADSTLQPGAWLAVGRYEVETLFPASSRIPKFEINVTAEYDKENPLDLTLFAPVVLPPNTLEVTRVIDRVLAQQAAVDAMGFRDEAEQFAIAAGNGGVGGSTGPVSWGDILSKPTEFPPTPHVHDQYLTVEDLPPTPDLSGFVNTNDSRLSDAREPLPHTHDQYLTAEDLPEGQDMSQYVQTTDSRLSDARTPLAHSHPEYLTAGDLPPAPDLSGYVQNGDVRLSDARTPLGHSHSISDVTGLQQALQDASNSGGGGTVAPVSGLSAVGQLASTIDYGMGESTWAIVSDSTADGVIQWPHILFQRLAQYVPSDFNVNYHSWNESTNAWRANVPISTGGSTNAINVWNGSRAGSTFDYQQTRMTQMFGAVPKVDTLVVAHGHNYDDRHVDDLIDDMELFIADFKVMHPGVKVIVSSQNPQLAVSTFRWAHMFRNWAIRQWALENNYVYIPAFERFTAAGADTLVWPDGIHPTTPPNGDITGDYGSVFWAELFLEQIMKELFTEMAEAPGTSGGGNVLVLEEGEPVPPVTEPTLIVRY